MTTKENADEMNDMKQHLFLYKQDLQRSAVAYDQLKQENEQLNAQIEKLVLENTTKLEQLEQECYSLRMKLSQQAKMANSYNEEIENTKISVLRQQQEVVEKLKKENNIKVERLNRKVISLQSDLEQSQLSEEQIKKEKEKLQTLVNQLGEELQTCSSLRNESSTEEVAKLSLELNSLMKDKMLFSKELIDWKNKSDQLELLVEKLQSHLEQQNTEVEENKCQVTSYFNLVEHLRAEIQELKVELDAARMETTDMKKKGNSLFAEVEDRRIEVEKQMISMKVQNESLKKQLAIAKQNHYSVKNQMAALLQISNVHADMHHMEQLIMQLSQASGEVSFLTVKLNESEQREKSLRNEILTLKETSGGENADYINYLQTQLQRKEREMGDLQKELQTQRLITLAETETVKKCEQKLYSTEQMLGEMTSMNFRQTLKIEEMKLKYEPDAVVTGILRKTREEKIPLPTSSAPMESSTKSMKETSVKQTNRPASSVDSTIPGKELSSAKLSETNENKSLESSIAEATKNITHEHGNMSASITTIGRISSVNGAKHENRSLTSDVLLTNSTPQSSSETEYGLSQPKSILANPYFNVVKSKTALTGSSKTTKRVTVSNDVQIVDGETNEVSICCRADDTSSALELTGPKRMKGRQKQSRVVSVSDDLVSVKDECKTQ